MPWILLLVAGLFEIGWAIGLKYTDGLRRPVPTVLSALSMIASVGLLGLALRTLPVGSAYAVWTGVGTVGTALLGIVLFAEPVTALRMGGIGLADRARGARHRQRPPAAPLLRGSWC
jgi:quaternary ammonium compound-resistance protein SugE